MHKLIEYICNEMDELERKADKEGKLSMAEVQYADMLAHLKKNILTSDAMMEADDGYSGDYSYARGRGRGSNARRDSMGRYSGEDHMSNRAPYRMGDGTYYRGYSRADAKEDMIMQLKDMEKDADEESKQMIRRWIKQVEEQ